MPRPAAAFLACACICLSAARPASPQDAPPILGYDTSVRSAALGGASNALFWGEELNSWGNPALLGEAQGIHVATSRTTVEPGAFLSGRASLRSTNVTLGGYGVGLVFSGRNRIGGVVLDYGTHTISGPGGFPTASGDSFESVDSWGFGVSLARAIRAAWHLAGADLPPRDRFDVSYGMNFKKVATQYLSDNPYETAGRDWGFLLRLTPFNGLDSPGTVPARVDLAGGMSTLTYNDDATLPTTDGPFPVSRHGRTGASLRVAADPPQLVAACVGSSLRAQLLEGLRPFLSIGVTADHEARGPGHSTRERYTGWGVEVTVARVIALRRGHVSDDADYQAFRGATSGWSVGLPIGPWAGFIVEQARYPQPPGSVVGSLRRHAVIIWIDPIAFGRAHRVSAS